MKTISLLVGIAAFAASFASSHGAVVYSGLQDIPITTTFDGVYLNVDAGTTSSTETLGWDINPFFGGEGIANSAAFQPVRATVALDAPILSLSAGDVVDGTRFFLTGFGGSEAHVGTGPGQFVSGSEAYIGFKLTPDDNSGTFYGWMRVTLANDGSAGVIRDWAYETSGSSITAGSLGAVPEPSAFCALAMAGAGLCWRRRK